MTSSKQQISETSLRDRWITDAGHEYYQKIIDNIHDYKALEKIADDYFGYIGDLIDLRGINFKASKLVKAKLTYCDLSYSNFFNSNIDECVFAYSDISYANFKNTKIAWSEFANVVAKNTNFNRGVFISTSFNAGIFIGSDLREVKVSKSDMALCDFSRCEFEGVFFHEVAMSFSKMTKGQEEWIEKNKTGYNDVFRAIEWLD